MARRGRLLTAGVVVLAVTIIDVPAFADSRAPLRSHTEVSPGGKYVFVMIAPYTVEEETRPWAEATAADIREIRRMYRQSGMYRNDGSTEPLWTVDWFTHGVEVASDGVHLIRYGALASSTDQEALSFFANGRLLRTYLIRELVDYPVMLQRTVSHFLLWWEDGGFDDARLEYRLTTKDGNRFAFDVRTGQIVSEARPARSAVWGTALAGVAVLGLLARLVRRRRVRSQVSRA